MLRHLSRCQYNNCPPLRSFSLGIATLKSNLILFVFVGSKTTQCPVCICIVFFLYARTFIFRMNLFLKCSVLFFSYSINENMIPKKIKWPMKVLFSIILFKILLFPSLSFHPHSLSIYTFYPHPSQNILSHTLPHTYPSIFPPFHPSTLPPFHSSLTLTYLYRQVPLSPLPQP